MEDASIRRDALFAQLVGVHETFSKLQDEHNATDYRCHRHGACCNVGLQLHYMECEHIARGLQERYRDDPKGLERVVSRLERAFEDTAWTWANSVGDDMCAFYDGGCSIYPSRPAVCRAYGVVIEVDEWCPRKRLPTGEPFVFKQKETDRFLAHFYRTLDVYGRLLPQYDYTVYMPRGVLEFLVPRKRLAALRKRTAPRFWKKVKGYRAQYDPSYRAKPKLVTNVKFAFPIPGAR